MLNDKQLKEIKEHLENAQNPLFFYDNDADGLCSYLILRRWLGRGKGVAVRSYPDLNKSYARKVVELNADYVFVLDKPVIDVGFFGEVSKIGVPLVWIDHHDTSQSEEIKKYDNFYLYNPMMNKDKKNEPVCYISYKISNCKKDMWIALAGCIADHFMPEFAKDFGKEYPEFWGNVKGPFDALYETEIGKIAIGFNYGLKDSTSNIVRLQNFLIDCNYPTDVFAEVPANYSFRKKYIEIKKKYNVLLEKAKKCVDGKILFFVYSGDLSISSELSNELSHSYPKSYVIIGYKKGAVINFSLRGEGIKEKLEKVISKLDNASGGGHECAVGAQIQEGDLEKFKELLLKEVK